MTLFKYYSAFFWATPRFTSPPRLFAFCSLNPVPPLSPSSPFSLLTEFENAKLQLGSDSIIWFINLFIVSSLGFLFLNRSDQGQQLFSVRMIHIFKSGLAVHLYFGVHCSELDTLRFHWDTSENAAPSPVNVGPATPMFLLQKSAGPRGVWDTGAGKYDRKKERGDGRVVKRRVWRWTEVKVTKGKVLLRRSFLWQTVMMMMMGWKLKQEGREKGEKKRRRMKKRSQNVCLQSGNHQYETWIDKKNISEP